MEKKLLIENITPLIAEAMKAKDNVRLETLKLIKASLVKAQKDGIELNEVSEGKIINKMIKQSEDAIDQFTKGGRTDLADAEKAQLMVIKEFAPVEASDDEIIACVKAQCHNLNSEGIVVDMKQMKNIMSIVQGLYPTASGKLISEVVRNWQNKI